MLFPFLPIDSISRSYSLLQFSICTWNDNEKQFDTENYHFAYIIVPVVVYTQMLLLDDFGSVKFCRKMNNISDQTRQKSAAKMTQKNRPFTKSIVQQQRYSYGMGNGKDLCAFSTGQATLLMEI